jgi:hypothetical protein
MMIKVVILFDFILNLCRLFKLMLFRLVSLMSLFIIRYYADVPFHPCLASRNGNQEIISLCDDGDYSGDGGGGGGGGDDDDDAIYSSA